MVVGVTNDLRIWEVLGPSSQNRHLPFSASQALPSYGCCSLTTGQALLSLLDKWEAREKGETEAPCKLSAVFKVTQV